MNDSEKKTWMKVLLTFWGVLSAPIILTGFMPGPVPLPLDQWAWMFIIVTGTYLLTLSWRAAYLSGRKHR